MSRGTQAIINCANLRHNFAVLSQLTPNKLVLVVKADAYGHGLTPVVQALEQAQCFAVATIDEALIVRKLRPSVRILLLEGYFNQEELYIAIDNNFDCVIHQQQQLNWLESLTTPKQINIWLKFDSGMNRLGFINPEQFSHALALLKKNNNVNELILMSHFSSANVINTKTVKQQTVKFLQATQQHQQQLSLSNSSALLAGKCLNDEWPRVGLALFGVSPVDKSTAGEYNLKPVMTLQTNVIAIKQVKRGQTIGYNQTYEASKDLTMAVIGIGYGDGYPWYLADDAYVKLHNKKARIIGRVSMDMLAIDVTAIDNVALGDTVLIWGEDGKQQLPLEIVAQNAHTIPYVLLCQITSRVKYSFSAKH